MQKNKKDKHVSDKNKLTVSIRVLMNELQLGTYEVYLINLKLIILYNDDLQNKKLPLFGKKKYDRKH
jgi:hypothetical protein